MIYFKKTRGKRNIPFTILTLNGIASSRKREATELQRVYLEKEIERAGLDLQQPLRPDYPPGESETGTEGCVCACEYMCVRALGENIILCRYDPIYYVLTT